MKRRHLLLPITQQILDERSKLRTPLAVACYSARAQVVLDGEECDRAAVEKNRRISMKLPELRAKGRDVVYRHVCVGEPMGKDR